MTSPNPGPGPNSIPGLIELGPTSAESTVNLPILNQALLSTNPVANAAAANAAAQVLETPPTEVIVNFYDKFYQAVYPCTNYKDCEVEWIRNQIGTAKITLMQNDPLVPIVMNCWQAVVPLTIQSGNLRWTGRVEYCDYAFKGDENGGPAAYDVTVFCTDDWQWFDKIYAWPNPFMPIQVQFPSYALYIGPAITCIKTLLQENLFRLQSGLFEFVDNALSGDGDYNSWFYTLKQGGGNLEQMLITPMVVIPTAFATDTSPWISIVARMDKVSALLSHTLKDNGLLLTASLWLPGEPQPVGLNATLTVPTIVVDVKDFLGVTGPTSTFIDGLIKDVVTLQESSLLGVLSPILNPNNQYAPEGIDIAPVLGVNFVKPWVLFTDLPRSGLTEYHVLPHAPLAYTVIGGGKSPQWLNSLINTMLEWMIQAIEIAVGWTGVPDTLLDGTFDDILLAFQQLENAERRTSLGPYAFPEYYQQTGASAYTLDEWFALIEGLWDTRGYNGIIVHFDDGYPYTIGKDIFLGTLASFVTSSIQLPGGFDYAEQEIGGTGSGTALPGANLLSDTSQFNSNLYTDYVERITLKDSREKRRQVRAVIGDGKSHDDPTVNIVRKITNTEDLLSKILNLQ